MTDKDGKKPTGIPDLFLKAGDERASSADEARALVGAAGDADAVPRARALGYYMFAAELGETDLEPLHELLQWFVQHHPNDFICSFPAFKANPNTDPAHFQRMSALWAGHEGAGRLDADGLIHASSFFAPVDWQESERLLLVLHARDAKGKKRAATWLGKLHLSLAKRGSKGAAQHAARAIDHCRELAEDGDTHAQRICAEGSLLTDDLESAQHFAEKLVNAPDLRCAPDSLAHHVGHIVLGGVALRRGDRSEALAQLAAAGDTPGDHVTMSYGPRLALAKGLLAVGETDAVVAFLRKRATSWTSGREDLEAWIEAIERGEAPDWDDVMDGPS